MSGILATALAEIIKHASEIPIVRRISIASPPFAWHPLGASNSGPAAMPMEWMNERVQIGVVPDSH